MNWTSDQIALLILLVGLAALFGYIAGDRPRDE